MSSSESSRRGIWLRLVVKLLVGFLILVALSLFFLPFGAKVFLKSWLEEHGADSAAIEKVRLNIFTGVVALEDVSVEKDGREVFTDSTIYLNIGLKDLLGRQVTVQKAILSDVVLDIEQHEDGTIRIASLTIPAGEGGTEKTDEKKYPAEGGDSSHVEWIFFAREIQLNNVTLRYRQPGLKVDLVVEEALLEKLGTDPDEPKGQMEIKATLNGAPINVNLLSISFVPDLVVEGHVEISVFNLDEGALFIEDIVKPFSGTAGFKGDVFFSMQPQTGKMEAQYGGLVQIEKIDMEGDGWEVGGDVEWNGHVEYTMTGGDASENHVLADGTFLGDKLEVNVPEILQLSQEKMKLEGKTVISLGKQVTALYDGKIQFVKTGVAVKGLTADEDQFSWSGKVEYKAADDRQTISAKGSLGLQGLAVDLLKEGVVISQDSIKGEGDFKFVLGESPQFNGIVSAGMKGTAVKMDGVPLLTLGDLSMAEISGNGSGGFFTASVALNNLKVFSSEIVPVNVDVASVSLSEVVSPDLAGLSVARLVVRKPEITKADNKTQIAYLEEITAESLALDRDKALSIASIITSDAVLLKEEGRGPVATLKQLNVSDISFSVEEGLVCNTLTLDSIYADLKRKKKAQEPVSVELELADDEVAVQEPEGKKAGLPVKISTISVTGRSGFVFTDETLAKTFLTTFLINDLQVNDIDLTRPDHPFVYKLDGAFDKYTPLKIEGSCAPFGENLFVEQTTSLKNFSMLHMSPYSVEAIGTYFSSGLFGFNSSMKIADGLIDMTTNVTIRDVKAKTVDSELAEELNNQLPVSLDKALKLLKDKDGKIDINIPVHGALSDMNIGLEDIIVTALSKGITTTLKPYLAYTVLGPAGMAAAYLGKKVGKAISGDQSPVLEFEPGVKELNDHQMKLLDKMGRNIVNNGEVDIHICSRVNADELAGKVTAQKEGEESGQDREARTALFELGEARSLAVRDYLMSNFDIEEANLSICNPGLNFEKGEKPKVEFRK